MPSEIASNFDPQSQLRAIYKEGLDLPILYPTAATHVTGPSAIRATAPANSACAANKWTRTSSRGTTLAAPEPAAAAALPVPPGEGLVHHRDDLRVFQHLVGLAHPGFVQIGDLDRDQPVGETALRPPPLNRAPGSAPCRHPREAAAHAF
jgi:hypothetical protein